MRFGIFHKSKRCLSEGWYPTGTATTEGGQIVVLERRGFSSCADTDPAMRDTLDGNVLVVSRSDLDLEETTASVSYNFNRANEVFSFQCDRFFPMPARPGTRSPIEHVILIVKGNKTFDCVSGDFDDTDVDADPSLARWGEDGTRNQRAIAREVTISANFHVEAENSGMATWCSPAVS